MRILYITNGFPYPLTSGYLRHYHLIRRLAERHRIDLMSIVGADFSSEHLAGLEPYTDSIHTFRSTGRSRSLWRKATRRMRDLALTRGAEGAAMALAGAVARQVVELPPQAVVLSGKRTDPVLPHVRGLPLVVDMCDATSTRIRGALPYASPLRRITLRLELARVRAVEERLMRAGTHLIFASRRDLDLLLPDGAEGAVTVVPNGVDLDYWRRTQPSLGEGEVVFSGAMSYPPNADAARFLVDHIMPRVWSRSPEVRVRLVGRDPEPSLLRRATDSRVAVTGFVDDVRPHLETAAVYVAPLRFAAGIQNKLLEAMAMELPVVTSPVAAAGLQTADDDDPPIRIASGADEFAVKILDALAEVRSDARPRADARRYVSERFDWDRSAGTLERLLLAASEARAAFDA